MACCWAGCHVWGAGRDYVPVAALLVLLIGGSEADSFSLGYGVQMVFGIVVGLLVNLAIFPPLALTAALSSIHRSRAVLIAQLDEVATALLEQWPPGHEHCATRDQVLDEAVGDVRGAVHQAAESQKGNPRSRLRSRQRVLADSYEDLAVLEGITFYVRDLSEILAESIWEGTLDVRLEEHLREPVFLCLSATADVLRRWEAGESGAAELDDAQNALAQLISASAASHVSQGGALAPGAGVAIDVKRILSAVGRRLVQPSADQPLP